MKAPRRILQDPEASPELREDLQRTAANTVNYDLAGGLAALQLALGPAAISGAGTSASPTDAAATSLTGASAAATGIPLAVKWFLLAALSGTAIGTVSWLSTPSAPPPAPAAAAPAVAPSQPPAHFAAPSGDPAPVQISPEPEPEPEPVPGRSSASPSRREIAQLIRIRALLERDPIAAHRAIAAARREFPTGVLREEREGLDAIALFRSGQERRARVSAERFIEHYPQSPLRPRLERLLAGETP